LPRSALAHAVISLLVGLVMTWSCLYGLVSVLQGPIARALNGIDLSWRVGLLLTPFKLTVIGGHR
jgi:hypothetical protein